MRSSQFDAKPDEVDHWTPESHGSAGCWHWVVDCEHLLNPLSLEHHAVDDGWIRSLAYDRVTQRLEVRFKWHSVHQYRPVPLQIVREIWKARPMNTALQELVMKDRRIGFDEVRSEGKLLVSLLRGWALIAHSSGLRAGSMYGDDIGFGPPIGAIHGRQLTNFEAVCLSSEYATNNYCCRKQCSYP